MSLNPGTKLGPYEILAPLGAGGMGEVYKAKDTRLDRTVAVKVLPSHVAGNPEVRQRFEREARAVSSLNHPHICTLYDIGQQEGVDFLVMEYLEGETLGDRLKTGPLPFKDALRMAVEMAEALEKAHEKNIVHRDLKPSNVMLSRDGHVKVMDFGLSKQIHEEALLDSDAETRTELTRRGLVVGTPTYMSPEQLRGSKVDTRTDVFSFGVVLYEMLTGAHPFERETAVETMAAILREAPKAGGFPETLGRLVEDLLAKEPDERLSSFKEVQIELERILERPELLEAMPTPKRAFVGRESETAVLLGRVERLRSGHGSLVLIGGEPGVGKTRLCKEALDEARRRGMLALEGNCYETEGAQPFIPFVESLEMACRLVLRANLRGMLGDAAPEVAKLLPELRRMFDDIPEPLQLPPEQQRRFLFNCFQEFAERASKNSPMVLLVDDLHWADESSLLLLQHLAQHLEAMPILILGTYRDVELEADTPFEKLLTQLVRQRLAQRISLKPLSEESVSELLAALGRGRPPDSLVRVIYDETEGNPFFVEEVFQYLSEEGKLFDERGEWRSGLEIDALDVPEGVRLVIGRRLRRLSDQSRRVLTGASVVGPGFGLELLEGLGEVTGDALLEALEEAERAKLITSLPERREARWMFTHALIRHTVLSELSLPRRQRWHLRVANAMERVYARSLETQSAEIARHLSQAGVAADSSKTLRYLTLAAKESLETTAFEQTVEHCERALALLAEQSELSESTRADLLLCRGQALRSLGCLDEALAAWQEALDLYEQIRDLDCVTSTCAEMVHLLVWRGEVGRVLAVSRQGLRLAGDKPSASRVRMIAGAGLAHEAAGEHQRGHELMQSAVAQAESLGEPAVLGQVLHLKALSHWASMEGREWAESARRAAKLLHSAGDFWEWAHAVGLEQIGLVLVGQLAEGDDRLEPAEAFANQHGHYTAQGSARLSRGLHELLEAGDLDRFREFAQWYVDFCTQHGFPWKLVGYSWLGLSAFWKGEWHEAMKHFESSVSVDKQARTPWTMLSGNLFMAKAYAGHEDAGSLLEQSQADLPRAGKPNSIGAWATLLKTIEGLAVLGERDKAAALYPLAVELIENGTVVEYLTVDLPQLAAGIAASCGREWERAEEHFGTALRQAREIPHRIAQPRVRHWYAQMLIDRGASGGREKAQKFLEEALEGYRDVGMPKHVALLEEMMAGS